VRHVSLLIVVPAVLLVAGCGGGSKSSATTTAQMLSTTTAATTAAKPSGPRLTKAQYEAKLTQIAKDVATSLGGSTNASGKLTQKDIDKVVSFVHSFTEQAARINPPVAVAALHARLIQAMNDVADEFPDIAATLNKAEGAKDAQAAISALFGAKGFQELIALQTDFKAKGYTLNLNG
jgi:hypothetical protein